MRALVGIVVFAVAAASFSRIPLLPEIGSDLSLTTAEIGLLTTAFGLGRLAMDLPAGRLLSGVSPRLALIGAGTVLSGACALLAASVAMAEALAASALIGCASAMSNTTGMYTFATRARIGRRGASMAIFTTALMSGQMVGPALGGVLGSLWGWRAAMAVAAGIGLAVALACVVWGRRDRSRTSDDEGSPAEEPRAATEPPFVTSRLELTALAAVPFATFFGIAGLIQTLVPVIGDRELGFGSSTIGIAIAAGAAVRFVTAWATGVGSDRLSRKAMLVPSLAVMALGAGVLALPATSAAWGAAILLLAAGSSGISVAAAALADRISPARLGHELGLFRLVGDLGLLVGPVVCGFLYQESGPVAAGAASAAVFVGAAAIAAAWVREEPGQRRADEIPIA